MAYGLKYELLCKSKLDNNYKLQLKFDSYTGSEVDRDMPADQPLLLKKDKADIIRGTSLEFGIREEVDFELDEFYTNNSKKIKCELYKDSTLIWTGYNLPQQYQAPYIPAPVSTRFTATDGLGLLKNESFTLTGRVTQLAIIKHCIDKIDLGLGYSIAINLFETSHNHSLSSLAQTYEDSEIYEDYNCYEVIEMILGKYDAEITQLSGRWHITCSADKQSSRMLYSSAGVYETTQAAPAVLDLGYPDGIGIEVYPIGQLSRSMEPGGKKVIIKHDFGRKDSLMTLRNFDFTEFSGGQFTGWTQDGSFTLDQRWRNGKPYAYLDGVASYNTDSIYREIDVDTAGSDDFIFAIDYAPIGRNTSLGIMWIMMTARFKVTLTAGAAVYYLTDQGEWTMTATEIRCEVRSSISDPVWNKIKVISTLPASGKVRITLYRYFQIETPESGDDFTGIAFSNPYTYFQTSGQLYPSGLETLATFDDSTEPDDLGTIEVSAADAPDLYNNSLLYQKITRLSDDSPTTVWHRLGSATEYSFVVQLARTLASRCRIARQKLTGTIKGSYLHFGSQVLHTYNSGRVFEISEGVWDMYEEKWNITLLEILAWSNESVTFSSSTETAAQNAADSSPEIIGTIIGNDSGGTETAVDPFDTNEPTGFVNRSHSVLSFAAATGFAIAPAVSQYKIYSAGTPYIKTFEIPVTGISDVGLNYIYFDTAGDIQKSLSPWDINSANVPVACVYWNGTDGLLQDERHGIQMDGQTHEYLHETRGSSFAFGLTGVFATNGSTFSIGAGEWYDEDIEWKNASAYTQCRIFWLIGSAWHWTAAQNAIYHSVSSVPQYNSSGTLANVGSSKYSMSWIFITNNTTTPVGIIMGQGEYNTQAQAEAITLSSLSLGSLPAAEMLLLYKVVWQRDGSVISIKSTQDYRRLSGGPVSNYVATDHAALAHLNYASAGHTGFEADLGLPASGGYILYSTVGGVRSWGAPPASTGNILPFQCITLGDPIDIDATTYKDWICSGISGDATLNLNNTTDGDAGMIELIMGSASGVITFGTMFTKKMGPTNLASASGSDNVISWRMAGEDIIYTIGVIE
jgi:hypothetical protein